jgi:hypothetical protein
MTRYLCRLLVGFLLLFPFAGRSEVITLDSVEGAARFQRLSDSRSALSLLSHLETEIYLTFCGPASLATALNSLGVREPSPAVFFPYRRLTQASLFTERNLQIKTFAAVQSGGLTLEQLAAFARNLGVEAQSLHAEHLELVGFRERLLLALRDPNMRVVVNYSRIPLGQEGDGHISPVAAYDEASDSVLILDVARYKYSPVWISLRDLVSAMERVDPEAGRPRGALFIKWSGGT